LFFAFEYRQIIRTKRTSSRRFTLVGRGLFVLVFVQVTWR